MVSAALVALSLGRGLSVLGTGGECATTLASIGVVDAIDGMTMLGTSLFGNTEDAAVRVISLVAWVTRYGLVRWVYIEDADDSFVDACFSFRNPARNYVIQCQTSLYDKGGKKMQHLDPPVPDLEGPA